MNEEWKKIKGFEDYKISNLGRVKSLKWNKERILNFFTDGGGYYVVKLSLNGKPKAFNVHRLVAETFLKRIDELNIVNHKDGDKQNNNSENLEWTDISGNVKHAFENNLINTAKGEKVHGAILKENEVLEIRKLYKTGSFTQKELGNKYNVSKDNIGAIINRRTWKHI